MRHLIPSVSWSYKFLIKEVSSVKIRNIVKTRNKVRGGTAHPVARTLLDQLQTPRSESHTSPLPFIVFIEPLPSACVPPLLGSYRRRDEMKPSISVIAAARRFLAILPLEAPTFRAEKGAILLLLPTAPHFSLSLSLSLFLPYARGCWLAAWLQLLWRCIL